jgi:hypothetical protein
MKAPFGRHAYKSGLFWGIAATSSLRLVPPAFHFSCTLGPLFVLVRRLEQLTRPETEYYGRLIPLRVALLPVLSMSCHRWSRFMPLIVPRARYKVSRERPSDASLFQYAHCSRKSALCSAAFPL